MAAQSSRILSSSPVLSHSPVSPERETSSRASFLQRRTNNKSQTLLLKESWDAQPLKKLLLSRYWWPGPWPPESRSLVTWAVTSWIPITVQCSVRVHQCEQQPLKKKLPHRAWMFMEWTELRRKPGNEESHRKGAFLWCRASLTYLGGMLAFKYSSIWLISAGRNIFFSVSRKGTLQASTTRRSTPALRKVKSVPFTWEYKSTLMLPSAFQKHP